MFNNLFGKRARKSAFARTRRLRAQFDVLEDRLVMTSLSGATAGVVKIVNPPTSPPPVTAVNLVVEPRDLITGALGAVKSSRLYSFQLQAGDYVQAEVCLAPLIGGSATCQMSILNSSGTALHTSGPNAPYGFRAPASGTYYAEVTGSVTGLRPVGAYQLE